MVFVIVAITMSEDGAAHNFRLESWMSDLPIQLKDIPIIYLAIPGEFFISTIYRKLLGNRA